MGQVQSVRDTGTSSPKRGVFIKSLPSGNSAEEEVGRIYEPERLEEPSNQDPFHVWPQTEAACTGAAPDGVSELKEKGAQTPIPNPEGVSDSYVEMEYYL